MFSSSPTVVRAPQLSPSAGKSVRVAEEFGPGGVVITAFLIVALIVVIVLACVSFYMVYKLTKEKRAQEQARPSAPVDPFADKDADALRGDPRALKAGDIVDIFGQSYTVRGTLRLKEGGYQWAEHLLDTGKDVQHWLSVEEDPDLELVLWTETAGLPAPGAAELEHEGKRFRLEETGTARFSSEATTGLAPSGVLTYHDYRADDGTRLSFEEFGDAGRKEGTLGQVLNRSAVMIYPQQPS
ncbi:DUF4178 domain-containing protein [Nocardia cyriacigeorgica]|uniref:DUF4178 domain-containing protein n=1 Tax=Nocardia cyriacigeorgica TaxID=135487 RepID=UPI00201377BF|nr:DUF4178 domain-containing protein [Nocardia cyriacigeorgica]